MFKNAFPIQFQQSTIENYCFSLLFKIKKHKTSFSDDFPNSNDLRFLNSVFTFSSPADFCLHKLSTEVENSSFHE